MKIELPSSWEHITVKQFIEINALKSKGFEDFEISVDLLAILSGIERQKIEQLSFQDFTKINHSLSWMANFNLEDKVEQEVVINERTYRAELDIRKISAGQYIDLKTYIKEPKEIINNIHNILSVFYIPIGKKYNVDYSSIEVADEIWEHCPITVAYPVALFFWTLSNEWMKVIGEYLEKDTLKKAKKMLHKKYQVA